jgi:membrane-associated protease RseP (regulator of RpoE activity)
MPPQASMPGLCFAHMRAPRTFIPVRAPLLLAGVLGLGCGAVFPEVSAPLRQPPAEYVLQPPPPADLYFIRLLGADIPTRTRDGRSWDSVGGSAPDPFAKVMVNDKELLLTSVQSDTIKPTWPDQEPANYRIKKGSVVRVEIWDSNPLHSKPICTEKLPRLDELTRDEPHLEIECDNGGRFRIQVEPAHGKLGIGFFYELRTSEAFVTRVIAESPAGRAGLKEGDQILLVMGQAVSKMEQGKIQGLINANSMIGVTMTLKGADGRTRDLTLKDGGVYPTVNEGVSIE